MFKLWCERGIRSCLTYSIAALPVQYGMTSSVIKKLLSKKKKNVARSILPHVLLTYGGPTLCTKISVFYKPTL